MLHQYMTTEVFLGTEKIDSFFMMKVVSNQVESDETQKYHSKNNESDDKFIEWIYSDRYHVTMFLFRF